MRLPALLLAKLARVRIAQIFRSAPRARLLEFVDPTEVLHAGSDHPVSHEKIREIIASPAPIVWIGGSEPLSHPGIAHLVRALAPSGHTIFLETNGILLRRRIHEFQPLPQVFLVLRVDRKKKQEFALAVEGLRAAYLSGFFTAVHTLVDESSDFAELDRLQALLREKDVDGWIITRASANPEAAVRAAEARAWIPSLAWRIFAGRIERELLAQEESGDSRKLAAGQETRAEAREESVNVA